MLRITVGAGSKPARFILTIGRMISGNISSLPTYNAIVIGNHNQNLTIAEYDINENGYPISIK